MPAEKARRRILYIQYNNPCAYPPLEHSSRILADTFWDVLFLGIRTSFTDDLTFAENKAVTLKLMTYCPPGWKQKLQFFRYTNWSILTAIKWRPEWIYASDLFSCFPALILSFIPGMKVIYHEHDSPSTAPTTVSIRACLKARRYLARRAKICILPNGPRSDLFSRDLGPRHPVLTVLNCPSIDEIPVTHVRPIGSEMWVLYHGSIVPARLPMSVLYALKQLPASVKLRIVGYEPIDDKGYVSKLLDTASEIGIGDRVEYLGVLPTRRQLLECCNRCDIGIGLMPLDSPHINEQTMAGASNKAFEYLSCSLALLVSDLPDWRGMFVEPGYALACNPDDPEDIAAALRWFLQHPVEMLNMGKRGRRRITEDWNYEHQFLPIIRSMGTLIHK